MNKEARDEKFRINTCLLSKSNDQDKKGTTICGDKPSQVDLTRIINFDEVNRRQKLS